MAKASDNPYPSVLVVEGTVPASPAAGNQRLYVDSADHKLKRVNSAGAVTSVEGGTGLTQLASVVYNPVTQTTKSTSSTTPSDVDATNLVISFTATATTHRVRLQGWAYLTSTTGSWAAWNLRSGASDVANTTTLVWQVQINTSMASRVTCDIFVTGLTVGTAYTYKWGFRTGDASTTAQVVYGGTVVGAAVMEVWSA